LSNKSYRKIDFVIKYTRKNTSENLHFKGLRPFQSGAIAGRAMETETRSFGQNNDTQHMSDYNRFCDLQDQPKNQLEETRKRDKENYVK
jgi:hypothetical protein